MDIIINYILKYYIYFSLPSMIFSEVSFLIGTIVIFNKGRLNWKKFLINVGIFFGLWIPLIIIKSFFNYYAWNMTFVYLFVLIPFGLIKRRDNIFIAAYYILIFWTSYVFASCFAKSVCGVIFSVILGTTYTTGALHLIMSIIIPSLLIFTVLMIKRFPLDKYSKIPNYYILIPIFIDIIANMAKLFVDNLKGDEMPFFGLDEQASSLMIFMCGILIIVLNSFGYMSAYAHSKTITKSQVIENEIRDIKVINEENKNLNSDIQNNLEEMKAIRHDIKNQVAYMQLMLSQKDYEKLEEYFREINSQIPTSIGFADCKNIIIRNILSLEQFKAKQHGIKFDAFVVCQEKLNIVESDLTILLTNLIDNSIEAIISDKIPQATIKISIKEQNNYLFINVVNPISDKSKNYNRKKLITIKENQNLHGRGTKIIKNVTEKYNGIFSYEVSDTSFSVDVMLSLIM